MYVQISPANRSDPLPPHCTTANSAEPSRHSFPASEAQPGRLSFGNVQHLQEPLPTDAAVGGSVYADEAALPSFAQMAAAQGSLQQPLHSAGCIPSNDRQASLGSPVTSDLCLTLIA